MKFLLVQNDLYTTVDQHVLYLKVWFHRCGVAIAFDVASDAEMS